MTIEAVLHTTLENSRRKLIQASAKSNALVAWALSKKRIEVEDGGKDITNPLLVGRNPNVQSYEYYGQLSVAQTTEFDKVTYGWSRIAGTSIISAQEEDENRGPNAVTKILAGKMQALDESIQEKFSQYLYGAGAGTDPNGLSALIPDDPTTGSLGGISRVTESQWRTSSYDFGSGGITSANIEEAFDDVCLDLKQKSEKPDLILAGRDIYRTYRAAVRDKLVINLSDLNKGMVDLGFTGVGHNSTPIVYDEDCPVNKVYFINSKYLRMHLLKGVNMRVKKLSSAWNQDATGRRVVWQGQFCLWKAHRTHAVVAG